MSEPSFEDLRRENAELLARISALKARLAAATVATENERERLRTVYDMYDLDKQGVDVKDFDVLAFEAGVDMAYLSPESITSTLKQLNIPDSSRLKFDDFFRWVISEKPATPGRGGLGLLRAKLQAKAWLQSYRYIKAHGAGEQKSAAGSADEFKHIQVDVGVGAAHESKSGLHVSLFEDANEAGAVRDQVECPKNIKVFMHVDFGIRPEADEMQVGELCGMIEVVLDSLPWKQMPFPVHSHKVDIHETDEGGKKLRISVFTDADPTVAVGQDDPFSGFGKVEGKLSFPYNLDEFFEDKQKTLDLGSLGLHLQVDSKIRQSAIERIDALIRRLPEAASRKFRSRLAGVKFFKNAQATVRFGSLQELFDHVPDEERDSDFMIQVDQWANYPVGEFLASNLEPIKGAAATQKEMYAIILETMSGLDRVHVQVKNTILRIDVHGLNFVQFLPAL